MDDQTRRAEFDDAFAGLYLQARRATGWILGDRPAAEDAAAEALVRSLTRWHRVRAMPHRGAWVLRTASTVALERARRSAGPAVTPRGGRGTDGDLGLDRELVDGLGRLPRRQREAILLVRLGCAPADVAAVLEIPATAADRCVQRALEQLEAPLPRPASDAGRRAGRSVDEVRASVHREADRRARRGSVALGTSAVGAAALVLIALLLALRAEPAAELATAADPDAATTGPTTAATSASPRPDTPSPSPGATPSARSPETQVAGAAPTPTTTTTTNRPAGAPRRPAGAPAGRTAPPGPDTGPGPGSGSEPGPGPSGPLVADGATRAPTAPGPTGPASPTPTPTTPGDPPRCGPEDFGATDIAWGSVRSGRPYPALAAPPGETTWFALSVWADEGTSCRTADWRQELTITDADGTVVYQRLLDDGAGRLVEPGRWVLFEGWITWDPRCEEATPEPWTTPVCTPVGPGSYAARIVVAGAQPPPLAITILGP